LDKLDLEAAEHPRPAASVALDPTAGGGRHLTLARLILAAASPDHGQFGSDSLGHPVPSWATEATLDMITGTSRSKSVGGDRVVFDRLGPKLAWFTSRTKVYGSPRQPGGGLSFQPYSIPPIRGGKLRSASCRSRFLR
jgi:hypothetical protein